jgi:hypothetical protein
VLRVERKNKMLIEARDRRTQSGLPVVRI